MRGEHPAGTGFGIVVEMRLGQEGVVGYWGRLGSLHQLSFAPAIAGAVYKCGGVLASFDEARGEERDDQLVCLWSCVASS